MRHSSTPHPSLVCPKYCDCASISILISSLPELYAILYPLYNPPQYSGFAAPLYSCRGRLVYQHVPIPINDRLELTTSYMWKMLIQRQWNWQSCGKDVMLMYIIHVMLIYLISIENH